MCEDDPDLEDDPFMQKKKKKRLEEMKAQALLPKFGSLIEIDKT